MTGEPGCPTEAVMIEYRAAMVAAAERWGRFQDVAEVAARAQPDLPPRTAKEPRA